MFLNDNGVKLNEAQKVPDLEEEEKVKYQAMKKDLSNINELKEYMEVRLGGGHPNKSLKVFLENERKVLKFDISWFDDKYDKEEKVYQMHYYLADGKVKQIYKLD